MTLVEKLQELRKDISKSSLKQESTLISMDSDVCPICHGDEWILEMVNGMEVARPCKCQESARMKRRISFAEIPEAFREMRLNTFSLSVYTSQESKEKARIACKIIKAWLDRLPEMMSAGKGLYIFSGAKGSGKTRMAASVANELIDRKISVKFATSLRILSEIRRTYDKDSDHTESQLMDALVTAPVLVIDDFGTEKITDWARDKFYDIVNQRYVNKRVTLFTSNESLSTLKYDDRITNRIKEMCYRVDFPEESVRERIAEDQMQKMLNAVIGGQK